MTDMPEKACLPVDISDNDIYEAMKEIPGYLDITPGDFKEVYLKAFQHAVRRLTRAIHVSKIMTKDVARATRSGAEPAGWICRICVGRGQVIG
jgi:CBS-domain-containing membrane protein